MPDDKGNVSEQEKADLAKQRGVAAATIKDPEERRKFIAAQGDSEAKNQGLPVLDYQNLAKEASTKQALASYKKGTDNVPKTGNYKLHEGEAVLTKEENASRKKGKRKHLHKVITTVARDGTFGHEHIYKDDPESDKEGKPVFAGTSSDMDDLHQHMDDNLGPQEEAAEGAGGGEPDGDEPQQA